MDVSGRFVFLTCFHGDISVRCAAVLPSFSAEVKGALIDPKMKSRSVPEPLFSISLDPLLETLKFKTTPR